MSTVFTKNNDGDGGNSKGADTTGTKGASTRPRTKRFGQGGSSNSEMDPRALAVVTFLQRNILMIIGVIALIIALSITSSTLGSRHDRLEDQRAEIAAAQSELRQKQAETDEKYQTTMLTATGVDLARKAQDDKLFEDMMRDVLTWNSLPEYEKARAKVKERWGFSEDSQFMNVFMPGEMQGAIRKDSAGNTHYAFDEGISSGYVGADIYVAAVDPASDKYSYFALVQSSHASSDKTTSSTGYSIVTYEVSNGEIFNVAAMPTFGGVKRSY